MRYEVQRTSPFIEVDGKKTNTLNEVFSFTAEGDYNSHFVGVWSAVEDCYMVLLAEREEDDYNGIRIFRVGTDKTNWMNVSIEDLETMLSENICCENVFITEVSTSTDLFYDVLKSL